jgi:hypothetical protein
MAETTKIIIKQEYFDNVKVAIDALNNFFGSNFKTKNFPMIDSNEQLDSALLSILSWMNNVDPTWVEDPDRMNDVIDKINEAADNYEGDDDLLTSLTNDNDTSMLDAINAIIGHKMLQYIADHFEVFSELLNGIYTFELFTKPSMFNKALDTFSKPVPMDEIANALGDNKYQIFNEEKYIHGIFDNPQITLPKTMKVETEQTRFDNREDLKNVEINVDDTVQEQAEINYFVEMRPEHLRYNPGLQVVQISKQFEAKVNKLVSDLRACTTTDDLKKYFENFPFSPDDFTHVVIPAILARVFASSRKFPNQSFDQTGLKKYTDSYKSILSQNDGAKRFGNYDLFSTFKADKEGTIKFIEDFMKLRLVNDEAGMISNQTLLTVFNIFDSRIYLDIMYNMLPNDVRTSKAPSEDAFVKKVRAKINKNSRNANVYQKKPAPVNNVVPTSDQVVEYVSEAFTGTETISDLRYCEHYLDIIHKEIDTLGDSLYNHGVSVSELEEYIGESYDIFQEGLNGLIANLLENRRKAKQRASTESQIKEFESKYGVKLSEEHKSIILDNPNQYKSISDKMGVYLNCDYSSKMYKTYDIDFKYRQSIFKDNAQEMYPVIATTFDYDNLQYQTLYSDSTGNIYAAIYNKNHKFEKIASSIDDFFTRYQNKNVYWKYTEVCQDLLYVYYNEDTHKDEDHHVKIVLKTDSNGAVNPKAASDISMYASSGSFSELIVDEVLPKTQEKFGDICHITRAVFDLDGNMELFVKYNNKDTSLKTSGVWTESFIQEAPGPDVDGSIPDYMKTRIALSDGDEEDTNNSPKKPVVTDVQLPPDIPSNSFDDLGNSIDARLDTETDKLDNVLGSGYQGDVSKQGGEGKVVYNITYNYNNSYNQTNSNNKTEKNSHNITDTHNTTTDSSTGKTTNNNSFQNSFNSTNKRNTVNSHNVNNPRKRGSNNNNNSTVLSDTKDSNAVDTSKKDTFSTGKTIQEVFAFLESEEPLSNAMSAKMDPPKEDLLTKAMDNDKNTLPNQQDLKRGVQKLGNTARAAVKPISRTKQWLNNMVNSLIKRDENKVKAEMLQNPSYRSAVFKAGRIALKLGLFGVFSALNPYLGIIFAGAEGLKLADKNRLRKEVQDEFATELKIMDQKIEQCKHEISSGYGQTDNKKKQELYKLMRQRDKMQQMAPQAMRNYVKRNVDIY